VLPARSPVMAGMAKADSLQVSLGNIFVRRLRNPVGGHFGADCERQCFSQLAMLVSTHHAGHRYHGRIPSIAVHPKFLGR
jgi:hypothetical protein